MKKIEHIESIEEIYEYINSLIVVVFGVTNIRDINVHTGREAGNRVLDILEGKLLEEYKHTTIWRLRGSKFAVINTNKDETECINAVKNFVEKNKRIKIDDEAYTSVAAGIGIGKNPGVFAEKAFKIARVNDLVHVIHSTHDEDEQMKELTTKAIRHNLITPFFQKIQNIKTGEFKYESLVRIVDGDDVHSPHSFIDMFKMMRQYERLTKLMILKSFEKFDETDIEFSINLELDDLKNSSVQTYLISMLAAYDVKLVVEIVENHDITDNITKFLKRLKKYGVKIAIDDFGSGYSNFSWIDIIRPDYVKIDGSLICRIHERFDAVKAIVDYVHSLNIEVIAEFVKDEETLKRCKKAGVDHVQGFHIGKPCPDID